MTDSVGAGLPASSQHCPDIGKPAPTKRHGLPASSQHCPDIGEPAPTKRHSLPASSQHCPDIGEPAPTKRHGLPEIVRGFKTSSARRINQLRSVKSVPVWQRGYYEHIIRNEFSLRKIREYIINNPTKWGQDQLHPENIFSLSQTIYLNLDSQVKLPSNLSQ